MTRRDIIDRLRAGDVLVHDGATGTELEARGFECDSGAWSATANLEAPDALRAIHEDYLRAGADIITANNYCTGPSFLDRTGKGARWREYSQAGLEIALTARDSINPDAYIAGGISPMGVIGQEFTERARLLADGGADFILVEHNVSDHMGAAEACSEIDLPLFLGVGNLDKDGNLADGKSVDTLAFALRAYRVDGLLFSCTFPPAISKALPRLRDSFSGFIGACAHGGWSKITGYSPSKEPNFNLDNADFESEAFAEYAGTWKEMGAQVIGGCCGTGPAHIAAISSVMQVTVRREHMTYRIHWSKVICRQQGNYLAWPTIARKQDGELLVSFSGDREEHACPFGKTQLLRSSDNGETWSEPETINNTSLDDRDAGVVVLSSGTIVISWFTAPTWKSVKSFEERKLYREEQLAAWRRHLVKVSEEDRQRWLGNWTRRSTDGGQTWEQPVKSIASTPHGPIELRDGRLLYVGIDDVFAESPALLAVESVDEGRSWRQLGTMPIPDGDRYGSYCEPSVVELPTGRLVCLWRHQPDEFEVATRMMRQTESDNGGRTWTETHSTPIMGYPPHLRLLASGDLLATYGRRVSPMGQRACLSHDGGETWDIENEIVLRDDGPEMDLGWPPGWDLGYPASLELEPGELLTVHYQIDPPDHKPSIQATRWSLA